MRDNERNIKHPSCPVVLEELICFKRLVFLREHFKAESVTVNVIICISLTAKYTAEPLLMVTSLHQSAPYNSHFSDPLKFSFATVGSRYLEFQDTH